MSKVYVNVNFRLIISMDDGANIQDVMDELHCTFIDTSGMADVIDDEMLDFEVQDSK